MKTAILTIIIAICGTVLAAPFVTPDMIKRNGLTDEQYETLWKLGKRPQIDIGAARQWMFRANRYGNVTNWLDTCGKSNDFARLSYRLQDENLTLTDTNYKLNETNKVLVVSNEVITAENVVLTATNIVLEAENVVLAAEVKELEPDAKAKRKATKAAEKAAKKDSKNFEKWIKDTEKARSKSSEDMAEFYDSILEIATGTVPNKE